ncbi:MAG: protease inhibitor I42 family protein [Treponema sp.]|jgi:predicted secreted protein|nr:protease inhibitor I42 family protein [Treponema sp.]
MKKPIDLFDNQPDYRTSLIIPALFFLFCSALFAAPARDRERRIVIELEGNRTTGYSWTYVMEHEGIVREVSAEYREDAGSENRAGRGGVFVFTFESLKPGTVELRFGYARPWEKGVEPERTESYLLTVDRAGEIKAAAR